MFAITGAHIFTGTRWVEYQALIISGERIIDLVPEASLAKLYPGSTIPVHHLGGIRLVPGFIDLQINGAGGAYFTEDPTLDALSTMSKSLLSLGTTSFMATVISASADAHAQAQAAVEMGLREKLPGLLGIHIEGPFFAVDKRGCHPVEAIRDIDESDLERLTQPSMGHRMITLAPERVSDDVIRKLVHAGNHVCIGHTQANYEQVQAALAAGASGFTHLYNAMSNMAGREPNVVGAALESDASWCGIICDGHHVHAGAIRLAHKAKPKGKLLLVSDAMATLGSRMKSFQLHGETITEENGSLINAAGNLAGSAISLFDAVRLAHQWAGLSLDEALRMATSYPAQALGLEKEYGQIATGYYADLVGFDENFTLKKVMKKGQWITAPI